MSVLKESFYQHLLVAPIMIRWLYNCIAIVCYCQEVDETLFVGAELKIHKTKTTNFNWSTWSLVSFVYMKETMLTLPATFGSSSSPINSQESWHSRFNLISILAKQSRPLCHHLPISLSSYVSFILCTPLSISSHWNINIITLLLESAGPAIFCHSMGSTFHPQSTNFAHTDSSIA